MSAPILELRDLYKSFPIHNSLFARDRHVVKAVDGVSLAVRQGEVLSLVGEPGSGKSTIGRLVLGIETPTSGTVWFDGVEISALPRRRMRPLRQRIQMVFQDPYASLNPRMTIEAIVGAPLDVHGLARSRAERGRRVAETLRLVGLVPPHAQRYPHEFSGGQRQRIGIARALITNPDLLIADEPVSALDVSVQAQVVNLLLELKTRLALTVLFIAHDLAVVGHISDRIAVMYMGRLVELAPTRRLFAYPAHPYTEALLSAVPIPDPTLERRRIVLAGDIPSPLDPPSGCTFRTRCPYALPTCAAQVPAFRELEAGHFKACIRDDLSLQPAPGLVADQTAPQ